MSEIALQVNGRAYSGWTNARVSLGIEALASGFKFDVSEKWNGQDDPWQIQDEDACTVTVDGETVVTGFVDMISRKLDDSNHTVSIEGRSATAALIDCSADLPHTEFSKIGVLELCQQIAAPFGISVRLQDGLADAAISTTPQTGTKPKSASPTAVGSAGKSSSMTIGKPTLKLTIEPGESGFAIIDRACRMVGLLPVGDPRGGVVLTRSGSGKCATALVEGQNLLSPSITLNAASRYHKYIVLGQSSNPDGESEVEAVIDVRGEAIDAGVKRTSRTLVIRPEVGALTVAFAKQRAAWEATVRNARAATLGGGAQGWRQGDTSLWPINALVSYTSPTLGVKDTLLIKELTFSQSDEQGSRTEFALVNPKAYIPEPTINGDAHASWGMKGGV